MWDQETSLASDLKIARKRMGIYYTPDELTRILTRWAVRSSGDMVLEPSFGGCGFIRSALDRLSELGAEDPAELVFGCDIDTDAFEYLEEIVGPRLKGKHFLQGDFLESNETSWSEPTFAAIIGNPPYVSHHNMPSDQKRRAREAVAATNVSLPGTASLWAYFVIHSMSFLQNDGRLALILPDAFLTSYYARTVRDKITSHFAFTLVVRKLFHSFMDTGASERTLCLLADGYSREALSGEFGVVFAESIADVEKKAVPTEFVLKPLNGKKTSLIPNIEELKCPLERKLDEVFSVSAEDIVEVEIGLVTGANDFFIINQKITSEWRIPRAALLPILARTSDIKGIEFTNEDHQSAIHAGRRCWLFRPKSLGRRGGSVRRYLATVNKEMRRNTLWFRKRKHWYSPEGHSPPDAFLTYMNHLGPRLIMNSSAADCTNTLHRIRFKKGVNPTQRKLISVSLQSTFSQISAERVGRTYGGGVLKLEPSEFRRMRIVMPPKIHHKRVEKAFCLVNDNFRKGDFDGARAAADQLVLGAALGEDNLNLGSNELSTTLKMLRSQRCF